MSASEIVAEVHRRGGRLWADGDHLRCRVPRGVLTPGLREKLLERKAEILALLREEDTGGRLLPAVEITPAPEERHLPFPLTDMQQAYWIGRSDAFELGNIACHVYVELEGVGLDPSRINRAWRRLIDRHDMLRAVVRADGQQQILAQVPPYEVKVLDLRGKEPRTVASALESVRERMSHQVLQPESWPLFEVCASRLNDNRTRLHLSLDALIGDGWSGLILFRDLFHLYRNPDLSMPPLELSFRDYVLASGALRDSEMYRRSLDYWSGRIGSLPPGPQLPLEKQPACIRKPRFVRRSARLTADTWQRLKAQGARRGLTPPGVLLAAFSEVVAAWSRSRHFTISVPRANRLPLHPQVNEILGNFSSFTLLEVDNRPHETFELRAGRLQEQMLRDLDHHYVSGIQVLRELARAHGGSTRTPTPVVFTSVPKLNRSGEDASIFGMLGEVVYFITQTPQVWLDSQVWEEGGTLAVNWDAVEELFPERLLADMFDAYRGLLHRLAAVEGSWQEKEFALVPEAQLEQRATMNATEVPAAEGLLHTLFSAALAARRTQPAVIWSGGSLTYEEVDRRSNQVAWRLRELGAQPNTLVAVVIGVNYSCRLATIILAGQSQGLCS